ncbi:MAG: glycosyltransferase [Chloroflexota bacterium]
MLKKSFTTYTKSQSRSRSFLATKEERAIACILDEFTFHCLKPEIEIIRFSPNNWKDILEITNPKALFVESAWNGNGGSWQFKIAKYEKNMGDELIDLLQWAKKNRVPTIFWNKEDPPHYERFIDRARLFDYIFTSDANKILNYRKDVGHKRVYPLPFAAQPAIHNPILKEPRKLNVCFAGTYYGDIFPERKRDMDIILKPALDFGLHIYDRQYGMPGYETSHYRFPEIYQNAIRGKLEYSDMVNAYKQYKVFLNVNSVKDSPTMFSRRVFELLASGTAVISTYSKGIEELLGNDVVLFADSENETRSHLEKLLSDENYWTEISVRGIRRVMEFHTYNQRLQYMFEKCNLDFQPRPLPKITILSKVESINDLKAIERFVYDQTYRKFDLIIYTSGNSYLDLISLKARLLLRGNHMEFTNNMDNILSMIDSNYVALISPKDYYSNNYLKDYALATMYAGETRFFGKYTHFIQKGSAIHLQGKGNEYIFVNSVPTATLVMSKTGLKETNLASLMENEWFIRSDNQQDVLSLDRFNYLQGFNSQNIDSANIQKICV